MDTGPCVKQVVGAAVSPEELSSALCDVGGGREAADGGDFCILTTDACCLRKKLTQHWKAIILQCKKKNLCFKVM